MIEVCARLWITADDDTAADRVLDVLRGFGVVHEVSRCEVDDEWRDLGEPVG